MKPTFLCPALLLGACAILFPIQEAKADVVVYAGAYYEQYGTLDLTTGVFTLFGRPGDQAGFGELGGKLYAGDVEGDTSSVNPANGSDTFIATGSTNYDTFGSTTTGVYAVSDPTRGNPFLTYSVNPATGVATLLGSTGQDLNANGGTASLSTGSNTLYWTWTAGPHSILYSLNTTTGFANEVGDTDAIIGAMVYVNGTLYGEEISGGIDILNTSDGLATPTGVTVSGLTRSEILYGMAPLIASTPEPSSVLFLITAFAVMGYRFRVRQLRSRSTELPGR
jgi:hypothetical protein